MCPIKLKSDLQASQSKYRGVQCSSASQFSFDAVFCIVRSIATNFRAIFAFFQPFSPYHMVAKSKIGLVQPVYAKIYPDTEIVSEKK